MTYKQIQDEVKRRSTRDQGGTQYDDATKNTINSSLFRLSREAAWRSLRRKTTFSTVTTYTTGSGAGSFDSTSSTITVTGATFLTDGIEIGRRIKLSGDSTYHTIKTITGETTLTIEENYGGTTTITGTYSILGQGEYNLPIQAGHRMIMWHEEWGYPVKMEFITDQEYLDSSLFSTTENIPVYYRMWGEDMVEVQLKAASTLNVVSTSTSDTAIPVTVFGKVGGYPDYEILATNGTTAVSGSKAFQSIERVVKGSSSVGRIRILNSTQTYTVATIPVGDTTPGILYKKIQIYPLPNSVFDMNILYYKDPYRLVNDGDVHELGETFDEALILLSVAKIKGESEIAEGTKNFFSFYKDELKSLRKTNADKPDWFPTLKAAIRHHGFGPHPWLSYSQAGPHYGRRSLR